MNEELKIIQAYLNGQNKITRQKIREKEHKEEYQRYLNAIGIRKL